MANNADAGQGLTPGQDAMDATNRGAPAQTIQPLPEPAEGDQDIRSFPSNGAIPDEVRNLLPTPSFHVP